MRIYLLFLPHILENLRNTHLYLAFLSHCQVSITETVRDSTTSDLYIIVSVTSSKFSSYSDWQQHLHS